MSYLGCCFHLLHVLLLAPWPTPSLQGGAAKPRNTPLRRSYSPSGESCSCATTRTARLLPKIDPVVVVVVCSGWLIHPLSGGRSWWGVAIGTGQVSTGSVPLSRHSGDTNTTGLGLRTPCSATQQAAGVGGSKWPGPKAMYERRLAPSLSPERFRWSSESRPGYEMYVLYWEPARWCCGW